MHWFIKDLNDKNKTSKKKIKSEYCFNAEAGKDFSRKIPRTIPKRKPQHWGERTQKERPSSGRGISSLSYCSPPGGLLSF